jgi:C1A family cysteine protease
MSATTASHGWIPDAPDTRDHSYEAPAETLAALPPSVDLRAQFPPVFHQGHLHSCTANAVVAVIQFLQQTGQHTVTEPLSRLFIYYNARKLRGTEGMDGGAHIRDALKSINAVGACDESHWPYPWPHPADRDQLHALATYQPPERCYQGARRHQLRYLRLRRDLAHLKGCLASGYPFIFGFYMSEAFDQPAPGPVTQGGVLPMPPPDEPLGAGHAVVAVGYDDAHRTFLIRNSWGPDWGIGGHIMMPYAFLMHPHRASDFWTVRSFV